MGRPDMEESASKIAEWSEKETEELTSDEEVKTARGTGEVGMMPTATAEALGVNGAEYGIGGAAAGRGATLGATYADADAVRSGATMGRKKGKGEGLCTLGKPGQKVLWSGRERGGAQGIRIGGKPRGG